MLAGQKPKDRARDMDWVRNKKVEDFRGGDDVPFGQLNSVPVSQRSPEERKKDVDDILDWIRIKKEG